MSESWIIQVNVLQENIDLFFYLVSHIFLDKSVFKN